MLSLSETPVKEADFWDAKDGATSYNLKEDVLAPSFSIKIKSKSKNFRLKSNINPASSARLISNQSLYSKSIK